jgi:hypothetical protein
MGALRAVLGALVMLGIVACAARPEVISTEVLPSFDPDDTGVRPEAISYLEAHVILPDSAGPLESYDRYYSMGRVGERDVIQGVYLLRRAFGGVERNGMAPVSGRLGVFRGAADDLPVVADGGCAVVSVYFDIEARDFLMLQVEGSEEPPTPALCNGLG